MSKKELKAFTLIELLVVIGIIGILSAIGVVSFGAVREKARRGACIATLRSNFNSDENLVAYWNFDEGADTTAKDFWGHNGTFQPAPREPSYVIDGGIIDHALSFDIVVAEQDYVVVNDSSDLEFPKGNFTIEGWFKGVGPAITKGDGSGATTTEYILNINSNTTSNGIQFFFKGPALGGGWRTPNPKLFSVPNTWNYVAVTFIDSSDPNDRLNFFLNNNNPVEVSIDNNHPYATTTSLNLYFGKQGSISTNYFNGSIDELIIYNRTLSADEITRHYKACKK